MIPTRRSKKHREAVELLRLALEAEEDELGGMGRDMVNDSGSPVEDSEGEDELPCEASSDEYSSEEDEGSMSADSRSSAESQQDGGELQAGSEASSSSSSEEEEEDEEELDDDAMLSSLLAARSSRARAEASSEEEPSSSDDEDSRAGGPPTLESLNLGSEGSSDASDSWSGARNGKKWPGGRRRGKAGLKPKGKQTGGVQPPAMVPAGGAKGEPGGALSCGICKEQFPSRNQLFKHIQRTGHAQLKA